MGHRDSPSASVARTSPAARCASPPAPLARPAVHHMHHQQDSDQPTTPSAATVAQFLYWQSLQPQAATPQSPGNGSNAPTPPSAQLQHAALAPEGFLHNPGQHTALSLPALRRDGSSNSSGGCSNRVVPPGTRLDSPDGRASVREGAVNSMAVDDAGGMVSPYAGSCVSSCSGSPMKPQPAAALPGRTSRLQHASPVLQQPQLAPDNAGGSGNPDWWQAALGMMAAQMPGAERGANTALPGPAQSTLEVPGMRGFADRMQQQRSLAHPLGGSLQDMMELTGQPHPAPHASTGHPATSPLLHAVLQLRQRASVPHVQVCHDDPVQQFYGLPGGVSNFHAAQEPDWDNNSHSSAQNDAAMHTAPQAFAGLAAAGANAAGLVPPATVSYGAELQQHAGLPQAAAAASAYSYVQQPSSTASSAQQFGSALPGAVLHGTASTGYETAAVASGLGIAHDHAQHLAGIRAPAQPQALHADAAGMAHPQSLLQQLMQQQQQQQYMQGLSAYGALAAPSNIAGTGMGVSSCPQGLMQQQVVVAPQIGTHMGPLQCNPAWSPAHANQQQQQQQLDYFVCLQQLQQLQLQLQMQMFSAAAPLPGLPMALPPAPPALWAMPQAYLPGAMQPVAAQHLLAQPAVTLQSLQQPDAVPAALTAAPGAAPAGGAGRQSSTGDGLSGVLSGSAATAGDMQLLLRRLSAGGDTAGNTTATAAQQPESTVMLSPAGGWLLYPVTRPLALAAGAGSIVLRGAWSLSCAVASATSWSAHSAALVFVTFSQYQLLLLLCCLTMAAAAAGAAWAAAVAVVSTGGLLLRLADREARLIGRAAAAVAFTPLGSLCLTLATQPLVLMQSELTGSEHPVLRAASSSPAADGGRLSQTAGAATTNPADSASDATTRSSTTRSLSRRLSQVLGSLMFGRAVAVQGGAPLPPTHPSASSHAASPPALSAHCSRRSSLQGDQRCINTASQLAGGVSGSFLAAGAPEAGRSHRVSQELIVLPEQPPGSALTSPFVAASNRAQQPAETITAATAGMHGGLAGVSPRTLVLYDSLSVVSGLWAGLWLRLWLLVAVQAPLAGCSIWLAAAKTSAATSVAAAAASTQTCLRVVWYLAHVSLAVLGTASRTASSADTSAATKPATASQQDKAGRSLGSVLVSSGAASILFALQFVCVFVQQKGAALAAALPGGTPLVQLLMGLSTCVHSAGTALAAGVSSMTLWLSGLWGSVQTDGLYGAQSTLQTLFAAQGLSMLALLQAVLLRFAALGFRLAESLVVMVAEWALRDVPPVGRAAVYGSARMTKNLVVEAGKQSVSLAGQLLEAWRAHPY